MMSNAVCPNCEHKLSGQYCSNCGQNQKGSDRYFLTLVNEAFEGLFSLESKAWRTTLYMLFRPGLLTKEHFQNRRARYISPLRLYLITSISFFLLVSGLAFFSPDMNVNLDAPFKGASATNAQVDGGDDGGDDGGEKSGVLNEKEPEDIKEALEYIGKAEPSFSFNVPFVSEERERSLNKAMEAKIRSAASIASERPKLFVGKIIDSSPPVVLFILPIFALVLKLFYLSSNRYYTQHLVLAVHNHSFMFAAMSLITLVSLLLDGALESWLLFLMWSWVGLYMCLSLKTVFEQSWSLTLLKGTGLLATYVVLFCFAVVCISLLGIILI